MIIRIALRITINSVEHYGRVALGTMNKSLTIGLLCCRLVPSKSDTSTRLSVLLVTLCSTDTLGTSSVSLTVTSHIVSVVGGAA